jgi:hypothetical protein
VTTSALIDILVRVRDERRSKGTDVTHTERELVEAIALTGSTLTKEPAPK